MITRSKAGLNSVFPTPMQSAKPRPVLILLSAEGIEGFMPTQRALTQKEIQAAPMRIGTQLTDYIS